MSEMNEYTPELFELIDEDGNKKQFELIDDFLNSDCEMVILKSSFDGEEEFLASIDDDDEYEKVAGFFLQRLQDAIDSDDYDDFDEE